MLLIEVYGPRQENTFLPGFAKTKAQTSMHINAVWSAPLSFPFWKVSYQNLRFLQPSMKYVDGLKNCQNRPPPPPLPDRIFWICPCSGSNVFWQIKLVLALCEFSCIIELIKQVQEKSVEHFIAFSQRAL